jgi:hypothetical protein
LARDDEIRPFRLKGRSDFAFLAKARGNLALFLTLARTDFAARDVFFTELLLMP